MINKSVLTNSVLVETVLKDNVKTIEEFEIWNNIIEWDTWSSWLQKNSVFLTWDGADAWNNLGIWLERKV